MQISTHGYGTLPLVAVSPPYTHAFRPPGQVSKEIAVTTPTLCLTDASVTTATVDALVMGITSGEGGPRLLPGNDDIDAAFDGGLIDLLCLLGARGKADEVIKVPTRGAITAPLLIATGLGEVDGQPSPEQIRRAAGAASRALSGTVRAVTTLSLIDLTAGEYPTQRPVSRLIR
jgi:leucyl aminopeptidase